MSLFLCQMCPPALTLISSVLAEEKVNLRAFCVSWDFRKQFKIRSLFVELKSSILWYLVWTGPVYVREEVVTKWDVPLWISRSPEATVAATDGGGIPLRSAFCLAFVSVCFLVRAASSAAAEEEEGDEEEDREEERNRLIQTSSKADLCECPAAACEPAACSFGWGESVCAAAATVPPGFKRNDCSVTNESLLRSHFLFAGGTIWRVMLLCAVGVKGWSKFPSHNQTNPKRGAFYCPTTHNKLLCAETISQRTKILNREMLIVWLRFFFV